LQQLKEMYLAEGMPWLLLQSCPLAKPVGLEVGGRHPLIFSANVVGMAGLILWCHSVFEGWGILPELGFVPHDTRLSQPGYSTFRPYPKDPVQTRAANASRDCCWTGKGTSRKKGSSWHMCAYDSHCCQFEIRWKAVSTVASASNCFPQSIDITLNSSSGIGVEICQ
jgi:hypothetical protein